MVVVSYNCGCYITRSMYGERKIVDYGLCVWHNWLFDEDKTAKQIVEEMKKIDSKDKCYCHCHLAVGYTNDPRVCPKCEHDNYDGVLVEDGKNGWMKK